MNSLHNTKEITQTHCIKDNRHASETVACVFLAGHCLASFNAALKGMFFMAYTLSIYDIQIVCGKNIFIKLLQRSQSRQLNKVKGSITNKNKQ